MRIITVRAERKDKAIDHPRHAPECDHAAHDAHNHVRYLPVRFTPARRNATDRHRA